MTRSGSDRAVRLSVFDRLIDFEPRNVREALMTHAQSVHRLKESVRRDLEWLLNTRLVAIPPDERFREVNRSVYAYGLPDFTAYTLSNPDDQNKLIRHLQMAIKIFEPRLANVRVVPLDDSATRTRTLRFRIEALLLMDPVAERISFDTVLQLSSGEYEVVNADELLRYYEDELSHFRQMGTQFAEKYPKIASRLRLESSKETEDPHVERLIEAFAFLAARVHLKLDDDFPEIAEALLGMVYPHFVRPIPSMAIADFQVDVDNGKLTTGLKIHRGATLYSRPVGGVPCKFRTCYETTLWPLSITAAEWKTPDLLNPPLQAPEATYALRLEARTSPDAPLPVLGLDKLRLHLAGASNVAYTLYELLCSRLIRVVVRDPGNARVPAVTLPASALRPVGFAEDEGMFPYDNRSFIGYRLLQELFTIPAKFLFVEVSGLDRIWAGGFQNTAELIFLFSGAIDEDRRQRLEFGVTRDTFRVGCVPIVNLFSQTAEPVLLDQYKHEYQVIPEARRPHAVEIFSVDEVSMIDSTTRRIVTYQPFHSHRGYSDDAYGESFWIASRRASNRPHDNASDVYLSLVDRSMRALAPRKDTLTVRTTSSNRDLPSQLPFGNPAGDFELEGNAPVKSIISLTEPTRPVRPPAAGLALWRLISHLSLNYLSLVEGGRSALQQVLRLYDFRRTPAVERMIQGITGVSSRPHFARVISENGIAFARGTRVELELDEDQFVGSGVYLFASVMEQFLALYTSLNSFTQLVAKSRQRKGEVLREWPPRAGRKILL